MYTVQNRRYYCRFFLAGLMMLCFISAFISSNEAFAVESVVIKKYNFGSERRSSDGKPIIYPHHSLRDEYDSTDNSTDEVDVNLSVNQENESVLATLIFNNISTQSYFFPKSYFPMRFQKGDGELHDALCGGYFYITSDNVTLDHLTGHCSFDLKGGLAEWINIPPGGKLSLIIHLNDMYAFLPELKTYNISSISFKLVRKDWFLMKSINDTFFSILMRRVSCNVYNIESIHRDAEICGDFEFNETMSFFVAQIQEKDDKDNSIYVSSNEISKKVNGDNVRLPY